MSSDDTTSNAQPPPFCVGAVTSTELHCVKSSPVIVDFGLPESTLFSPPRVVPVKHLFLRNYSHRSRDSFNELCGESIGQFGSVFIFGKCVFRRSPCRVCVRVTGRRALSSAPLIRFERNSRERHHYFLYWPFVLFLQ